MLENYVKKFGKVCIGIHGKELPKYSDMQTGDESKAWWKQKRGYTENPMYKSHKILSQDHKFWAKNDQIFVSDVLEDSAPADPFKTTHIQKHIKTQVSEKVNHTIQNKPGEGEELNAQNEGPGVKKAHNYKWTTVENQFCRRKKRLFDDLQQA